MDLFDSTGGNTASKGLMAPMAKLRYLFSYFKPFWVRAVTMFARDLLLMPF